MTNANGDTVAYSDSIIGYEYQQVLDSLGLIIKVNQTDPLGLAVKGKTVHEMNELISSEVVYLDDGNRWLTGVADDDGLSVLNWIRAGEFTSPDATNFNDVTDEYDDDNDPSTPGGLGSKDPEGVYESLFEGTI